MKFLFEYLTDSLSLLENPIEDYVVMAIIGALALMIAYSVVGKLYSYDIIEGRGAGHILHWIIRLIVFVVVFYAFATAIRIYNWFQTLPNYKWWIIGSVVGLLVLRKIIITIREYRETATVNVSRDHNVDPE